MLLFQSCFRTAVGQEPAVQGKAFLKRNDPWRRQKRCVSEANWENPGLSLYTPLRFDAQNSIRVLDARNITTCGVFLTRNGGGH